MLDPIHATTHERLQLGEGVLLRGVDLGAAIATGDPAAVLSTAMHNAAHRIGVTKAGCVFRCVPRIADSTNGQRTPAAGELLAVRWEVTLSGTLLEIAPSNAAMLLNIPMYISSGPHIRLQPENRLLSADTDDVCWVGDLGRGLLAIGLSCPVSTGGMILRTSRNGLGEMDFTLMARQRDPGGSLLPCQLLWLKEVSA